MIYNQRGSTILVAMISVLVVGLTVNTMLSEANFTYTMSTNSRVRSAYTNLELRLRQRALSSTSYICPNPNQPNQCNEVPGVFAIRIPVPSADCAVAGCGVVVLPDPGPPPPAPNQFFDPTTLQIRARLIYEGREKSFPERSITISVPADILVPTITCPDATPLFMGFANGGPNPGAPICNPIPGIAGCGPGEFLSEVEGSTLGTTCLPLPLIDCPSTHVIESMNWVGAGNVTHTCRPRWEPFAYYGFTSTIVSGPANTQPPLPNPPDNPPPDFQKRTPLAPVACNGQVYFDGGPAFADTLTGEFFYSGPCPYPSMYQYQSFGNVLTDIGNVNAYMCGLCGPGSNPTGTPPTCTTNPSCTPRAAPSGSPSINCVGSWGSCVPNTGTCGPGAGIQLYSISQAAQFGGTACPFAAGATQVCNLPACVPPPSGGG